MAMLPTRTRLWSSTASAANAAALAIGTALMLAPGLASACAVCFTGRSDETREAFIGATAFMTFLPMLVIGGVVWWLRRRVLAIQSEELARAAARSVATGDPRVAQR